MKLPFLVISVTLGVIFLMRDVSAEETSSEKPHHKKGKKHRKHKKTTTILPQEDLEVREESYFKTPEEFKAAPKEFKAAPEEFKAAPEEFKAAPEEFKEAFPDDVISRKTLVQRLAANEISDEKPVLVQETQQPIREIVEDEMVGKTDPPLSNPCNSMHCSAGKVCEVSVDGVPECVCIKECPQEVEVRRKVCNNFNETWGSDCDVYRKRCVCERDASAPECGRPEYAHVHIEYYGECRHMPECKPEEMDDFPRRMRDWLFYIMQDLADRDELSPHFMQMEREAETNMTRRWTNAAVWKFCDLDGHPPDRSVSRHELFPIRAPVMAMEHCIAPFLNKCDADDNHLITLSEWAKCLQLQENEIEYQCEDVRSANDD